MTHDETLTRAWTVEEVRILSALVRDRVAAPIIALKMKRTEAELRAKASELGWSLPV